jgi:hypothetical protein
MKHDPIFAGLLQQFTDFNKNPETRGLPAATTNIETEDISRMLHRAGHSDFIESDKGVMCIRIMHVLTREIGSLTGDCSRLWQSVSTSHFLRVCELSKIIRSTRLRIALGK